MTRRGVPEPALNSTEAFASENALAVRDYDALLEKQLGGNIVAELSARCDALAKENRMLRAQVTALSGVLQAWRLWRWLTSVFRRKEPR